MPYLHFSKFLIMKHNFTLCTTLRKYYELLFLQKNYANLERTRFKESMSEDFLYQSKPAMSNPWPACSPVEGFVWPSLGFCCSAVVKAYCILTTSP